MRFYEIIVYNDDGSQFARWGSLGVSTKQVDPGALEVEIDIPLSTYDSVGGQNGQGAVKIYGIGLQVISQSHQFAEKTISVALGMSKGLPLAVPAQQGVPIKGTIYQGFGNWSGINQSLDLIFTAATGSGQNPSNCVVNWKSGTKLADAIANTLKVAFPNLKQSIQISSNLVLNHDETGVYQSLDQFASYCYGVSKSIITGNDYQGVKISIANGTITVYDGTTKVNTTKEILFTDLIGQPTWISAGTIQVHTIMRGDIVLGDIVKLPQAQQTFTAASNSQFQNSLTFSGEFIISRVRCVGKYRNPNAENWITVLEMASYAAQ